jgi:hypothetical protein
MHAHYALCLQAAGPSVLQQGAGVVQLFRIPGITPSAASTLLAKAQAAGLNDITDISAELV